MPVSAPADRRFRRAHVSPSRRRSWRHSWRKLARAVTVFATAAVLCYVTGAAAMSSAALTVRRISIEGNERIATGEVHALLEGLVGSNMLTVDIDVWRQKLRASPWIADAAIRRVFPSAVSVVLSERRAVGIGRIDDALYLIDQSGMSIDEFGPNYAELDLPIIDGLAARGSGGFLIDEARADLASRLLAALQSRPDLAKRVSQIDVGDAHNAVIVLKDDATLLRIGDERFVERLQSYVELAPALRERVPDIDYVDLRYDERVYVRSQRPDGAAQRSRRRGKS
jgi:cell division protein FtsQ